MARKGDLIVVNAQRVGGPPREGEILEVIARDLRVQYRVRWSDGHESVFAPGAGTARIEPAGGGEKTGSVRSEPKTVAGKASAPKGAVPTKSASTNVPAKATGTKKSTARKSTARKGVAKRRRP